MFKLWRIAYRDLGRNRRRSLLTMVAVALGAGPGTFGAVLGVLLVEVFLVIPSLLAAAMSWGTSSRLM